MKAHFHSLRRIGVGALLGVSAFAAAIAFMPAAQAQGPSKAAQALHSAMRFPAGLQWQKMAGVSFDFPPRTYGTPEERQLAAKIWEQTLAAPGFTDTKGRFPAFILLSAFDDGAYRYIFTSMSAAPLDFKTCEPPPNGGDASTPIYSTCPMRVVVENRTTGAKTSQDFANYCNLFPADDGSTPGKSETEIAFDKASKTAYFRVIQYSKPRPECNRAIKLG